MAYSYTPGDPYGNYYNSGGYAQGGGAPATTGQAYGAPPMPPTYYQTGVNVVNPLAKSTPPTSSFYGYGNPAYGTQALTGLTNSYSTGGGGAYGAGPESMGGGGGRSASPATSNPYNAPNLGSQISAGQQIQTAAQGGNITGQQQESQLALSNLRQLLTMLPGAFGSISGIGGAGPTYGGPSLAAAQAAAMARAQDLQGQMSRGALNSWNNSMAANNMLGSGLQARGTVDIANAAQSNLANLNAQQLADAYQAATTGAQTQFGGDVATRGQNIQLASALMGLLGGYGSAIRPGGNVQFPMGQVSGTGTLY